VGNVVNLRLARKARARVGHEAAAAANRALHGRTKQQKQAERADRERQARLLDGARTERE
jgi:hypothetical protein